jgi:prepilin-type N-terminal cleavage/methylation domain-containing protein
MTNLKKAAFTMLELVMVIVVLGIIAALALPRMDRDIRQEAADNVLSAIRYTQHLALMDNKTNPSDSQWLMTLWHIRFSTYNDGGTKWFYTVGSNMNHRTNINKIETAIDPTNSKYMYNANADSTIDTDESPNIFIGKNFGINSIVFTGGCAGGQLIAFDHLGRPHVGIYSAGNDFGSYMSSDCIITFDFENSSYDAFSIEIDKETGYAFIVGQPYS